MCAWTEYLDEGKASTRFTARYNCIVKHSQEMGCMPTVAGMDTQLPIHSICWTLLHSLGMSSLLATLLRLP